MSEYRKLTNFEKFCKIFGKIKIPVPKSFEKRLKEEIDFCHFEVTPSEVFSTSIIVPTVFFFISYFFLYVFGFATIDFIISFLLLSLIIFYFLFNYTKFQTIYYRSKFSSEMVLSIIYMSISLQTTKNLEVAVSFAANNLRGLLGLDLKRALWNVQTGKSISISEELSKVAEKWRKESEEFVDAISLLKSSINLSEDKFHETINEAVEMVLKKTKTRMKEYALNLKTPLSILTNFGIFLPLLLMIFLPLASIFLPDIIKTSFIYILYLVILPSIIYLLLRQHFYSRPYSYHQIEFSSIEHKNRKIMVAIFSLLFIVVLTTPLLFIVFSSKGEFGDKQFLASVGVTISIGLAIFLASYFYRIGLEETNNKILVFEDELPTASYQLASLCRTGKPIERIIEEVPTHLKDLSIREIFSKASEKMKYGLSLEKAFFDENAGALRNYNSRMIKVVIKTVIDLANKGSLAISRALDSIARFLEDAKDVNKFTDEILDEVTSDMKIIVYIFAPLSAGIIVGLLSMLSIVFYTFAAPLQELEKAFTGKEYKTALEAMSWLLGLSKTIYLPEFQIVIGLYMISIVVMLSYFLGELKYGEDEVSKIKDIGKAVLISMIIYCLFSVGLYYIMKLIISAYPIIL